MQATVAHGVTIIARETCRTTEAPPAQGGQSLEAESLKDPVGLSRISGCCGGVLSTAAGDDVVGFGGVGSL